MIERIVPRATAWTARVERHGVALSAIMADIDHFKQVNDEYLHAAGDVVAAANASAA